MCAMSSQERTVVPIRFSGLKNSENVVFFGNNLGVECQRCGAYNQTSMGHKYCAHVSCPIALREFKRRKRKRTSTLEQVYMPQRLARLNQGLSP
jgi:hypothetical protein